LKWFRKALAQRNKGRKTSYFDVSAWPSGRRENSERPGVRRDTGDNTPRSSGQLTLSGVDSSATENSTYLD
jgi:hypothetical protein